MATTMKQTRGAASRRLRGGLVSSQGESPLCLDTLIKELVDENRVQTEEVLRPRRRRHSLESVIESAETLDESPSGTTGDTVVPPCHGSSYFDVP
jgi:K+-sensing histidine kinase KdpD